MAASTQLSLEFPLPFYTMEGVTYYGPHCAQQLGFMNKAQLALNSWNNRQLNSTKLAGFWRYCQTQGSCKR
jgi:hypothetical protein